MGARLQLTAAVLLGLSAAAGAAELGGRPVTPLGELGARIGVAMPSLSVSNLQVPGVAPLSAAEAARLSLPPSAAPYPAAWDPARAAVLLERARAEGAAAVLPGENPVEKSARAPAQAEGPKPLLEAINSVLTDFSPKELRELPAEQLHALVGAIMDQSGPRPGLGQATLRAAPILARKRAQAAAARAKAEPAMDQPYPNVLEGHEMPRYTRDVPATARLVKAPYPVLRHYLSDEQRAAAVERGSLGNAVLPYVRRTRGVWHDYYETLTGVFFTLPEVKAGAVGVREEKTAWVDVALDASIPLFELEPGRIFLVPLPGRPEGWVADLYRRWIAGDAGALGYHGQLPRLEANGGPGVALSLPVTIVSQSAPAARR